jgi:hypothetical protein
LFTVDKWWISQRSDKNRSVSLFLGSKMGWLKVVGRHWFRALYRAFQKSLRMMHASAPTTTCPPITAHGPFASSLTLETIITPKSGPHFPTSSHVSWSD